MNIHDVRGPSPRLSRRTLLRFGGAAALASPLATLLAACGGEEQPAATTAPAGTTTTPAAGQATTPAGAAATPKPSGPAANIKPGGTLTVALGTDISSLEPQVSTETSSAGVRVNMFDQLLWSYTPDGSLIPWLAAKWEASQDGLTYTFALIDQPVKFHDGTDFNAEAVKATFDRLLAPTRTGAAKLTLDFVSKVEVVDPTTVKFTLSKVFAPYLRRMGDGAAAIMSPAAIQKLGEDYGTAPVGTGPYTFVSYKKGDNVTMEKNPNYWKETVNYDRLIYKITPEDASRATLVQTGEAQVADRIPPILATAMKTNPNVTVKEDLTSRWVFFHLNQNRDLMKNVKVRQSVNYAVDKKSIVQNILKGFGEVATSPLTKVVDFSSPQKPYEYDPAKAKSLLQEAGVAPGTKLIIWTPVGRYAGDKDAATAVQDMMKAVGFDPELKAVGDFPTYLKELDTLQWDMALFGWANANDPDGGLQLYQSRFSKIFPNWGSYNNPKVDDLINQAVATLDDAKRKELYAQIQQIIWDEAAQLFMHWQINLTGLSKKIAGVFVSAAETLVVRDSGYAA